MKYKTKPVIVEAVQWFKHGDHPAVHRQAIKTPIISEEPFVLGEPTEWQYTISDPKSAVWLMVEPGFWIITFENGGVVSCHPDKFEEKYELY